MSHVVFVVPYALETSMRFVRATAALPDVRLGIVSQEPAARFSRELGPGLHGYQRVENALDTAELCSAVRGIAAQWGGPVDRLLGILEQLQVPLGEARERLGITGMAAETARNFRDKSRMKDLLRRHDLPCAAHGLAKNAAEALALADELGFPLVVKPPAGAGAKNTFRVDRRADLEGYVHTLPPRPESPLLLEEFVSGKEHSFDSVSVNGRHVFHSVTEYYPSPLEVMESPGLQWCVVLPRSIDGPEYSEIRSVGPRALDVLGMRTGLTHMEWFRRPDGRVAISEVGARPPGAQFTTLLSWAHDTDFYAAWSRLMVHDRFDPPERRWAVGAIFLRGRGSGRVVGVRGLQAARRELGPMIVEARIPRVGQPQASSYEGEGYVILRDAETGRVKAGLRALLENLRVELGPMESER